MPQPSKPISLYSVQSWYNVYGASRNGKSILSCDEVIKIPVAEVINDNTYNIIPCVAIKFPNKITDASDIIEIETNEGITVTPFKKFVGHDGRGNYLLVLPPKTTGIKSAKLRLVVYGVTVYSDLMFDVMLPPYDYENALFAPVWESLEILNSKAGVLYTKVTDLESRVTALENKAGA